MMNIRDFQPSDFDHLLEFARQAVPFAPPGGNEDWLANRKAFDESGRIRRHYIAETKGGPSGYGCFEQQGDDPAWLHIFVVCSPGNLLGDVGTQLYERLLAEARELKAQHFWAREYLADEAIRQFFEARGFVETRRFTPPGEPAMVLFTLDLAE